MIATSSQMSSTSSSWWLEKRDRGSPRRFAAEHLGERLHGDRIESRKRLVQDQQLRLVQKGYRQLGTLLVSVRELLDLRTRAPGETEPLEPMGRGGARCTGFQPVETSEVLELLADLHPRIEAALLRHVPEAQPLGNADRLPLPEHVAGVELDDPDDRAHRRCLPGAVRAEKPQHAAGPDLEAHAVESDDLAEALRHVHQLEPGRFDLGGRCPLNRIVRARTRHPRLPLPTFRNRSSHVRSFRFHQRDSPRPAPQTSGGALSAVAAFPHAIQRAD